MTVGDPPEKPAAHRPPIEPTPAGLQAALAELGKEELSTSDRIALLSALMEARALRPPEKPNRWPQVAIILFAAGLALFVWTYHMSSTRIDVVIEADQLELATTDLRTLSFRSPFVAINGNFTVHDPSVPNFDLQPIESQEFPLEGQVDVETVHFGALACPSPGTLLLQVHLADQLAELGWQAEPTKHHTLTMDVGSGGATRTLTFLEPSHTVHLRLPEKPVTIARMMPLRGVQPISTRFSDLDDQQYSSIIGGRVRLLDSGVERAFDGGETLEFDNLDGELISAAVQSESIRVHLRGTVDKIRLDGIDLRPTIYETLTYRYKGSVFWAWFTGLATLLLALLQWLKRAS